MAAVLNKLDRLDTYLNLTSNSTILKILLIGCLYAFLYPSTEIRAQDRYVYSNTPLKQVITDIEQRSPLRFLYRDALISGKKITLDTSEEELITALESTLIPQNIQALYDASNEQILLSEARIQKETRSFSVTGHVLDNLSGTRLPFANITWIYEGFLQGVTTNESGYFHIQFNELEAALEQITLSITYVGYTPQLVTIDFSTIPSELAIRLEPTTILGHEVLISSNVLNTSLDTTWHHLLNPSLFSPFGESSVIRSLNSLPSVALSTALSDGLNVRGSKADGFQVLLDGAPIYNQNHFFGLFDAFNADALQTVGFYYDIAPASYFAPPGGTLSFITRAGSLTDFHASLGVSNTSLRSTLEGPLVRGKVSWLISGRHSYLDQVNWFNNQELVGLGLDIERDLSDIPTVLTSLEEFQVDPISSEARFYDIHAKLMGESRKGTRFTASAYAGGNHTELLANRLTLERNENTNRLDVSEDQPRTLNEWGNEALSFQLNHRMGRRAYLQTTLAASHYLSRYSKDDFVYTRLNRNDNARNFVFPFVHENELYNVTGSTNISLVTNRNQLWTAGGALNYYALTYNEQSATRPSFGEDYYALQSDVYSEFESKGNVLDVRLGLRGVYFSQGAVLRLSPRTQFTLFPKGKLSLRAGYSRNFQFLHQLYLENTNSPSIWIMTTGASAPSAVDNITAGVYIKAAASTLFQIEGYYRAHDNLRRHEINAPTQLTTANSDSFVPWFSENEAFARGIEFLIRKQLGPVLWTNAYTLAKVELQNEATLNGERFPAEWDRRHQITSTLQMTLSPALSAQVSGFYATGNPDVFTYAEDAPPDRLPDYLRFDTSLKYKHLLGASLLTITVSAYNLLDAENTWYRDKIQVFNPDRLALGFNFIDVDVFDLGFQPSFDISLSF